MAKWHEFTGVRGDEVLVNLDRIFAVLASSQCSGCLITFGSHESSDLQVQQSYTYVKNLLRDL